MLEDITLTKQGKIVFGAMFLMLLIPFVIYGFSLVEKRDDEFSALVTGDVLKASDADTTQIYDLVAMHIELPKGETPQIALLSDVSRLSSRAVFKNAKNGDYILIYEQAKKIILYRPSTSKIVDVINASIPKVEEQIVPTSSPLVLPGLSPSPDVQIDGDDATAATPSAVEVVGE